MAIIELTELVEGWQFVFENMSISKKDQTSPVFDEDCETVFIEMEKGHQLQNHNVIIGVIIYRPPNQDISSFNDKMINIVNVVRRENKTCYFLGDYNINILNYESHAQTAQFVDMMSSNGFLPLITRPARVTATSVTLIDNIFTNNIGDINDSVQDYS